MAWDDFITAAKQGLLPDTEFEKTAKAVQPAPKPAPNPLGLFSQAAKQASSVSAWATQREKTQAADHWLKQSFIDASQMGGGEMPPMDPSMMGGGMPPMDPSMMGGMGGAPPAGGIDPATGKPVKLKMEEVLMKETGRIRC